MVPLLSKCDVISKIGTRRKKWEELIWHRSMDYDERSRLRLQAGLGGVKKVVELITNIHGVYA
jgi:hypothetical protein